MLVIAASCLCTGAGLAQTAPAPLFRDPVTDGAADPVVIYNKHEKAWWMFYTQRRANSETPGVSYCYGNSIGLASSDDHGKTWVYRGVLDLDFENGMNTFWAPEVFYAQGTFHMYVSYTRGVRSDWGGQPVLMHYTSDNLWDWVFHGPLDLGSKQVIDPTVFFNKDTWYMWYKDSQNTDGNISLAQSRDLKTWSQTKGAVIKGQGQEGPKVFTFGDYYWMLTDEWSGMRVYRSKDLEVWTKQGKILADVGTREDDSPQGAHGDVIVLEDQAFVFYFTHPGRDTHSKAPEDKNGVIPYALRRSSIQVAALKIVGDTLKAVRNEPFEFYLPDL